MAKISEWAEDADKLLLLESWARDGLTEEQIANNMGIAVKTLYNWKKKSLPILQALKKGREISDYEVENALFKRATGFTTTEQVVSSKKVVEYRDGKRVKEVSEPCVIEVEKYYPPDTTADIFWLKNRKPEQWRDKQNMEFSGEGKVMIVDSIPDS